MSKKIPMKVQAALSRFESARATFEAFRKANSKFVEEYDMLREAYNSTLSEVKAVYRDNHEAVGKKLGDFSVRPRTTVDADILLELMGDQADPFVTFEAKIDRKAYDKAVESGLIPGEVVEEVEQAGVSVYGPKEK